jgi:hypothetical protein
LSHTEIELWLSNRVVGVDVCRLTQAVASVEQILEQNVTNSSGPKFATLQATIRPFLDALPGSAGQFTFKDALKEPFNLASTMRLIEELASAETPPLRIRELPARVTDVLQEWRNLTIKARQTHESIGDWFETTIATFNERYEMEMRRWTFGLSALAAFLFNADFLSIARASNGQEPMLGLTVSGLNLSWSHLPGILITTLLLSAGAPFWQDVLQSLFGIKALLRRPESNGNRGTTLGSTR